MARRMRSVLYLKQQIGTLVDFRSELETNSCGIPSARV